MLMRALLSLLLWLAFSCKQKDSPVIKEQDGQKKDLFIEQATTEPVIDSALLLLRVRAEIALTKLKQAEVLSCKNKWQNSSANSREDSIVCSNWKIDKDIVQKIIRHSSPISSSEWHYLYDVLLCGVGGEIKIGDMIFVYELNAGSHFELSVADTIFRYGYDGSTYAKYLLSAPWDSTKDE